MVAGRARRAAVVCNGFKWADILPLATVLTCLGVAQAVRPVLLPPDHAPAVFIPLISAAAPSAGASDTMHDGGGSGASNATNSALQAPQPPGSAPRPDAGGSELKQKHYDVSVMEIVMTDTGFTLGGLSFADSVQGAMRFWLHSHNDLSRSRCGVIFEKCSGDCRIHHRLTRLSSATRS